MKNITTWQKPALAPVFGMPICAPTSGSDARTRVDAAQVTGHVRGSDVWSPPIS